MGSFKVKAVELGQTIPFDDGEMNKWELTLQDKSGDTLSEIAHWLKVGKQPFEVGDEIEGELKNQPRGGIKLTGAKHAGSSNGAAPVASGGGGSDERGRSIERQVALKAAAGIAQGAAANLGRLPDAKNVVDLAEAFDKFLANGSEPAQAKKDPDDDIPF